MMIHDITEKVGRYKPVKRLGRGEASGVGGTSGRGHKGAKSRSGWSARPHYEGGQIPLVKRLPKRGFTNWRFKDEFAIVNVKMLDAAFKSGAEVDAAALAQAGLIRQSDAPLKVLGEGELTKKLTVTAAKFSASAKAKIEAAGGKATVAPKMVWYREGKAVKRPKPVRVVAPPPPPPAKAEAEAAAPKKEKPKSKPAKPASE